MTNTGIWKIEACFSREKAGTILCLLLSIAFALSLTTQTQAQTISAEAKRLYQEGLKARETSTFDDAMSKFDAALKLSPDYPEAHHALGLVYIAKDMNDKAAKEFNEVLRLNPNPRLVKQANWAIKRLEKSKNDKSERRNMTAPNVKNLIAGWDKIIPAVRGVCNALQSYLDTSDFEAAQEQMENARKLLNSNRYYPKWYMMQFEQLLVSPNPAQRLAVLTALNDLMAEVECSEEWTFFRRATLRSKLRSLTQKEKNSAILEEAKQALEKWEEGEWWWYEA